MIVYQLACPNGHFFEGWFASSQSCEKQANDGLLACPTCSSGDIRKLPAAPHVKGSAAAVPEPAAAERGERLRASVLAALRRHILTSTEDVGGKFAEVARRIHYKEEEARNIRGQASLEEAVALQEEGIEATIVPAEILPPGKIH